MNTTQYKTSVRFQTRASETLSRFICPPVRAGIYYVLRTFLAILPLAPMSLAHAQEYTFTTLAGLPEAGAGAVDGTGSAARFNNPYGIAVDGSGNLYVTDNGNHMIRKVTPEGVVTTLAGSGSTGSANGKGSAARFSYPNGVAVDGSGNVYVADCFNHTIRKVTPTGLVTTLAGLSRSAGSADGTGGAAQFKSPADVAVDSAGRLYVADYSNHTIRIGTTNTCPDQLGRRFYRARQW